MYSHLGLLFAASCLCLACDKGGDDKPEGGDDKAESEAKAESKDDAGDTKGDSKASAGGDEGGEASGAVADDGKYPGAIRECPKELSGRVEKDRVIGKECGAVTIKGELRVENASLILTAGANLTFADGGALVIGLSAPAKLVVEGTEAEPVLLTSAGDKTAGVWKGVRLETKAARSTIDGLVMEYGGDRRGALEVKAPDVTVKNSTFRHVKEAVVVADARDARFAEFSGNEFEEIGKIAMRVSPIAAGDIATDNTFPGESEVHVNGSRLEESATWQAISAPFIVVREIRVEGRDGTRAWLDVDAGTRVMFDGDGALVAGLGAEGGLRVKGSKDKPVVFEAHERQEPGAWRGVDVQTKGEVELAHLEIKHGGKRDKDGALHLSRGARARVENVAFIDNVMGVAVDHVDTQLSAFSNNRFSGTPIAIRTAASQLGSFGDGNTYEGDPRMIVVGERVEADMNVTLQQGAKVELEGTLRIDKGTTSIGEGFEMHVKDSGKIQVGLFDVATLKLEGSQEKPIRFLGLRDDVGTWAGITFHPKAKGNIVQHVVVRNAGTPAGIVFERDSAGKVDQLICEKCEAAALKRDERAKVEVGEVKATDGTPTAE